MGNDNGTSSRNRSCDGLDIFGLEEDLFLLLVRDKASGSFEVSIHTREILIVIPLRIFESFL